jgi:hypothetical protein
VRPPEVHGSGPGEVRAGDGDRGGPAVGPPVGLTLVTVGSAMKEKSSAALVALEIPKGETTVTSTVPAASAGDVTTMEVELTAVGVMKVPSPKLTVSPGT